MSETQMSAKPPVTVPRVHHFDSTGDAHDAAQCRDDIRDGDLLVIASEGVVALQTAWPAALTPVCGELHRLHVPAGELDGGRYAASIQAAKREADALGVALSPDHAPFMPGDRVVCVDGGTRSVTGTMRSNGRLWLIAEEGSAWRADQSERVDTGRVDEARTAARRAARALRGPVAPTDQESTTSVRELGEALRYLGQAAPDVLAELHEEATSRVTVEVPRLTVVPGDILHAHGVRLTVLSTGVSAGATPQWWATVHGVAQADRHATYRAPWTTGLDVEHAAWDVVTVERIAPALPA